MAGPGGKAQDGSSKSPSIQKKWVNGVYACELIEDLDDLIKHSYPHLQK